MKFVFVVILYPVDCEILLLLHESLKKLIIISNPFVFLSQRARHRVISGRYNKNEKEKRKRFGSNKYGKIFLIPTLVI
jgi:hypothetical protein